MSQEVQKIPREEPVETGTEVVSPSLVLQYFNAVDFITQGESPDVGDGISVMLWPSAGDDSGVHIRRMVQKNEDGSSKLRDEVVVGMRLQQLNLDAEKDPLGRYTNYSQLNSPRSQRYLQDALDEFDACRIKDGSVISIGFTKKFVSLCNVWVPVINS